MQENPENKKENKKENNTLKDFYKINKNKIFIFMTILLTTVIIVILFNELKERKNIKIGQEYIKAGIFLSSNQRENAIKIYEEIILSENKFYSILALNTIIEKNLVSDKNKIIEYFNIVEKSNTTKKTNDLIIFKKALYLIKSSDIEKGTNLLKKLINQNSSLKPIINEVLEK